MLTLVIGGAASGKSAFAETVCHRLHTGRKAYIATMAAEDEESRRRVDKHRAMRKDKDFVTVEHTLCDRYRQGMFRPYGAVLLECVSNLLANEMYNARETAAGAARKMIKYIAGVGSECAHVTVVSNDVFGAGESENWEDFTREYVKALVHINQRLAEKADVVVEVVYGIPVFLKGEACLRERVESGGVWSE